MYWDQMIIFIIQKQDEKAYQACVQSIQALKLPQGYSYQIVTWENKPGLTPIAIYNQIQMRFKVKYRIYLDEKVCFVNENFLADMLQIFSSHDDIGMLGMAGSRRLPLSGKWQDSDDKYGGFYILNEKHQPVEQRFAEPVDAFAYVQMLQGGMIATQYDVPWLEGVSVSLDGFYRAYCMEFMRAGYRLAVPKQSALWCLYAASAWNTQYLPAEDEAFQKEYLGYLSVAHEGIVSFPLYSFGHSSTLGNGYAFLTPEAISIGNHVTIGREAWFNLPYANFQNAPRIVIKDGCEISQRCVISAVHRVQLEKYVSVGDNVRIADYGYQYRQAGLPIHQQGADAFENTVIIGQSTRLSTNVVVEGNVHIGRGCLIQANSYVCGDIPDYCVAMGNPAHVVRLFDRESGQWLDVLDDKHLQSLLAKRKQEKPILTIGIPTYNRSYYLNKCLKAIYDQIGEDELFEVFVSDNDSEDNTRAVVETYVAKYPALRYHKNAENIGGKNFEMVWTSARGEFVVAVGDDDYFVEQVLYRVIHCIYYHRDSAIISLIPGLGYVETEGYGLDQFIQKISYWSTYISGLVMRHQYFTELRDPYQFSHTSLNQVYLQLEILQKHPVFSVLAGQIFGGRTGEAGFGRGRKFEERGNLGEVFIQQYFDILNCYIGKGLSEAVLRDDKKVVLEKMILPWCHIVTHHDSVWRIDPDIIDIYDKYYIDEPYYQEGKIAISKLLHEKLI